MAELTVAGLHDALGKLLTEQPQCATERIYACGAEEERPGCYHYLTQVGWSAHSPNLELGWATDAPEEGLPL